MQLNIFIIPQTISFLFLLELANKFNLLIRHLLKVLVKVLLIQKFSAGKSVYEYIGFLFGCEAKFVFTFKRSNYRVSFIRDFLKFLQNSFRLWALLRSSSFCLVQLHDAVSTSHLNFSRASFRAARFPGVEVRLNCFRSSLKLLLKFVRCLFQKRLLNTEQTLVGIHSLFTFSNALLTVNHLSSGLLYIGLTGSGQLLASFSKASRHLPQSACSRSNLVFLLLLLIVMSKVTKIGTCPLLG